MDGYQLYYSIKNIDKLKAVPFIFITAKSEWQDIVKGKQMGVEDYIVKPFRPEEVLATINGKLKRKEELKKAYFHIIDDLRKMILKKLSHEIKTPLTVIQGWTEFLQTVESKERLHEILNSISDSTDRLNTILNRFLFLYTLEEPAYKNKIGIKSFKFQVHYIVSFVIEQLQKRYENIIFDVNVTPSDLSIIAPQQLFKIILDELLDNACKFSLLKIERKPTPIVQINLSKQNDKIIIEITDNGIGIPQEEIPKITEKFYQYNREKYEQQGMGIGLSIVKRIVTSLKGELEIKSVLNKWTTAKITLPISS